MVDEPFARPDLRPALESAIRGLRGGDPLRPVTVIVPSHLLGVWLARSIFPETGHMAIDFQLLHELAWRVALPRLLAGGRTRVPENVDLALVLGAIPQAVADADTPEYLRAAAGTAGFAPAVLRTLGDLAAARVTPDAVELSAGGAADPQRLRLLARLARGYDAGLALARLVPRADLYGFAGLQLPSALIGAVVVCGLDDPAPDAAAFLEALRRAQPFALVEQPVPPTAAPRRAAREAVLAGRLGDAAPAPKPGASVTSLHRMQEGLFGAHRPRPGRKKEGAALDASVRVLATAGVTLEAVEIARLIQQGVDEGVRYQETAVLLRSPAAYAVALASAFDRAGIDAFFVEGVPRVDPAARGLSLLLDLVGTDLDRARVMEFLTSTRLRWEALLGPDAAISPSKWDRLSARAGIVSGLDTWRARLERARDEREAMQYEDDRDPAYYASLRRVIDRLASDLATIPETGTWSTFLDATVTLLENWIERAELTRERLERVLRPLAQYAPAPTRESFRARVRELLATQVYREGSLADGRVFVGSIASARGFRFRRVFIPGLAEGAFPGPVRPDPLLLDDERESLGPDLRTTRDRYESDRVLFLQAVRVADERLVLSYPRFDSTTGRERVPSSFLARALEAALGRRVGGDELSRLAGAGATALGRPHPEDGADAVDLVERDLALVASGVAGAARHLATPESFLVRSLALERSSRDSRLTAWDGIVDGSAETLAGLRLAGQLASASSVQEFAGCPYRHFLKRGLKLYKWEEPERVHQAESKDFGSLYHEVAHRLLAELAEQGGLPLRAEALGPLSERISVLVDESLAAFVARGGITNASLLDPVRVRLRSDLEEMLSDEVRCADRADEFVPVAFEQPFDGLAVTLGDGSTMTFRGTIDRIDTTRRTRRVRVVDYKTGKYMWKEDQQWKGGTELQLAVYNQAARALYPDHEVADATFYYATAGGDYKRKVCAATPEVDETLRTVLTTLDGLAAAGVFAPVADNCTFCDYDVVCGPGKVDRAARKKPDPRLAAFYRLRDIP